MAPVRTSGYVPLFSALTSYSAWLWLNCFTSSLTVSPSWPPIACQNEISVFANDSVGPTTSAAATTATAQAQRFMRASMISSRASAGGAPAPRRLAARTAICRRASAGGAPAPRRLAARTTGFSAGSSMPGPPHYSTRCATAGDAGATRRLLAELVRARDVGAVGLELGLQPAGRPAEERRHAPADRLGAVEPLAAAGADAGPPQQHVLEGHRQLVLHRLGQLGDDVGVARAQPLATARELAGEIGHARPGAAVGRHQRLERLAVEPGHRRLARDVEPRAGLDLRRLVVGAVERDAIGAAGAAATERAHDLVAQPGGEAPEARELGAGDRQEV